MPRARNIKPAFYKNEALAECSPLARLLFSGLWCIADREGRLEDRPKRIRVEILPYDDGSVDDMLQELHESGFILRYESNGQRYIQVLNFSKHQNPHHKEQPSTIPAPVLPETKPRHTSDLSRPSPSVAGLIPDSLNLIPDSLNPSTATSADADPLPCPADKIVDAYHRLMPGNPKCKVLNASRRGAIKARWIEAAKLNCKPFGYSTVDVGLVAWERFFSICADSHFLTGRANPQPGKPPFLADIDFLFSPKGFAGCIENKYHREAA